MFRRRNRRRPTEIVQAIFYPRGGWRRSAQYLWYRLRRLPDAPHRIGRGVAAGVFISFTPLFGGHLIFAGILALIFGGNVIAALLATAIGNPLTFPFIAVMAVTLGRYLLGMEIHGGAQRILSEIGRATGDLANNILALAGERAAEWSHLQSFFHEVFLPYLLGGTILGLLAALVSHLLTMTLIRAYQHHRRESRARKRAKAAGSDGAGTKTGAEIETGAVAGARAVAGTGAAETGARAGTRTRAGTATGARAATGTGTGMDAKAGTDATGPAAAPSGEGKGAAQAALADPARDGNTHASAGDARSTDRPA